MLEFAVLSSGSRGNCTFVSTPQTSILVDCGISARQVKLRLEARELDATKLDAIIISHEHSDHVRGIRVFAKQHQIPIYSNEGTLDGAQVLQRLNAPQRRMFVTGEEFSIGSLSIYPVSISHDANDPVGFRISAAGYTLGVITDLGEVTESVRAAAQDLDALMLETNHDPELLATAPYPWHVKERILGAHGHLSNQAAGEFLSELGGAKDCKLQVIVGAHVSENSNTQAIALESLKTAWKRVKCYPQTTIAAACAKEPSAVFRLSGQQGKAQRSGVRLAVGVENTKVRNRADNARGGSSPAGSVRESNSPLVD